MEFSAAATTAVAVARYFWERFRANGAHERDFFDIRIGFENHFHTRPEFFDVSYQSVDYFS
jgi:hypothetical protein